MRTMEGRKHKNGLHEVKPLALFRKLIRKLIIKLIRKEDCSGQRTAY